MITKQKQFVLKDTIETVIDSLVRDLTTIKDNTGKFLLNSDGLKVDDRSWAIWNWLQGVGLYGIYKNYRNTRSEKALQVVNDQFEGRIQEDAPPKNVDTMAPLLIVTYLYEDTRDSRYILCLEQWAEWVAEEIPRTNEGDLRHAAYGPESRNQLWDDTLMMTVLPLAKVGKLLNRPDYLEEAKHQFLIHIKYLQDKKSGLWYHGWTSEGNHSYAETLWARGSCWITIATPEIIEILELSKGNNLRKFLSSAPNVQMAALAKYQDGSGLWHTSISDSNSYLESSATAGFAYGILEMVRRKYIPSEYEEVANKAIAGLLNEIDEAGEVQRVPVGTGMGDNLDFYHTIGMIAMPYGQSLAILCLAELLVSYCQKGKEKSS